MKHARTLAAFLLLEICATGCATPESLARERATSEFQCARNLVALTPRRDLSDGTFDVNACGNHARYTCIVSSGKGSGTNVCAREPLAETAAH